MKTEAAAAGQELLHRQDKLSDLIQREEDIRKALSHPQYQTHVRVS